MTLYDALKQVSTELSNPCTFQLVADEEEFNAFVKDPGNKRFLFVWVETPVVDNVGASGVLENSVDFNGFMLTRVEQDTLDMTAEELRPIAIQPCRDMVRQAFFKLNTMSSIIDWSKGGISRITTTSTYGATDTHLHGVAIRCTINYKEGITGCTV